VYVRESIYVNGSWIPSAGTGSIEIVNSSTEEVLGTVPDGVPADVDAAVAAAVEAFPAWSARPPEERGKYLTQIADGLTRRGDEIAELIAQEVGMPKGLAKAIQVGLPVASFANAAAVLSGYPFEEQAGNSLIVKEPAGVVGAITPWNYPLHQIAAKVSMAMAAGCTVVLKPSEVAPLNAYILMEIIDEVGVPAGVVNLVSGTGPVVGEAIASHPDVDMVSFTGSTRAGRRVQELAAPTVKRVALELGGKSPNVILDDADLDRAIPDAVTKAFLNSGQTCSALTRLVVPRERLADVERIAVKAAEAVPMGDPLGEERVFLGPLVSETQRERVRGYIEKGVAEGARLLTGGTEPPEGLPTGYYVRPTIFSDVTPDMTVHKEEIFGPVLVIEPYDTEEDALRIANDTVYGLAGGVWSGDDARARRVARAIRAGQVEVNGGAFNPGAPFGGYKQSGLGREYGPWGLAEFLETKAIQT
jgi:acyl-CoA reductase-like NAD-dependent aldehyde dehydrogenase